MSSITRWIWWSGGERGEVPNGEDMCDDDLSPSRLGRKRRTGTGTEAETIERALDVEAFRQEFLEGLELVAGSGAIQDVFGEEDEAA